MFIGWLKHADLPKLLALAEPYHALLMDGYQLKLLLMHSPHLCYGAYMEGELVGAIMASEWSRSSVIHYWLVATAYQGQGIGERLVDTVIRALYPKSITITLPNTLQAWYQAKGFAPVGEIERMINVGKIPPFAFTNAQAQALEQSPFEAVVARMDPSIFGDQRLRWLEDAMDRNSSLRFALSDGFVHSCVIQGRYVYVGPWEGDNPSEAQTLMQGLLYFRGLKKIIADVPRDNHDAVELFTRYGFESMHRWVMMVLGESYCDLRRVYALAT